MAAVAPPADQAAGLLQNLSLDSKTKGMEVPEATKKQSVDSNNLANGQSDNKSVTPVSTDFVDPGMAAYLGGWYPAGYFYGFDPSSMDSEEFKRYTNGDGVEMNPGAFGDNGSVMYHPGYGYAPYGPYSPATSPVPSLGQDGQAYGAQQYQYPNVYFQSMTPTSGPYTTPAVPVKSEITTSVTGEQAPLLVDSTMSKSSGIANGGGAKGSNGTVTGRTAYQNSSYSSNGSNGRGSLPGAVGYQGFDPYQSAMWYDNQYFADASRSLTSSAMNSSLSSGNGAASTKNQNYQPHLMSFHHPRPLPGLNTSGYARGMYPSKFYGQYGNPYRTSMGYGSNFYSSRVNNPRWMSVDGKYKPRGRGNGFYGYGNESMDGLNELNRGPRAKITKNQKAFVPVALAVKGQNIPFSVTNDDEKQKLSLTPDREQYNLAEFPVTYPEAMFFIIKSYSEDDVHKSIKYNVWSSTPNGNKKLDAAYADAQTKSGGCPIFLFFSVNTSGQFVGVAEMVGPVDFNKNVEYWQQDKWIGCFPVKWHIVKDVPNSMLKHIILENNENKPVTNSRDTQEVKLDQGLEVLKVFKDYVSKQCILDDFDFYEDRQKRIQEKKAKQQLYHKQAQQVWEGKAATEEKAKDNTEVSNGDLKTQNSSEVVSSLDKEATPEAKTTENSSALHFGDNLKSVKPAVVPEQIVANGVANGC